MTNFNQFCRVGLLKWKIDVANKANSNLRSTIEDDFILLINNVRAAKRARLVKKPL